MYYYFQKILDWVREVLARMMPKEGKEDAGSLLNLNIILTPRIAWALQQWSLMYINLAPWTLKDDLVTPNGVKTLNIPAAIAAELARVVTIDMTCSITGSPRADFLNETMQRLIADIRPFVEYACAKGGLIFKPYITDDNRIAIDYVQADMFYPMAFDSDRRLTSCCFVDMKQVGGHFYKRFEYHILEAGEEGRFNEHVYNWNFKSTARDDMGDRCNLAEVPEWADIEEEANIEDVERPLYAYFRMPFANNIDPLSPIGVSCFARAVDLIEQTDKLWNDFLWEFDSGQRALYVDGLAFGKDVRSGNPKLPPNRLYRTLDMGAQDDDFFKDWTPNMREMSYINALESHYRMIEFQCGLSDGVLPRPQAVQMATATEVKMTQQRTYATITDTQRMLRTALEDLLYAIDTWASIYELAPEGEYQVEFGFDDSIVHDKDAEFLQDTQAIGLKVLSRTEFRMRNYDETESQAKEAIDKIDAENPQSSLEDLFKGQTEPANMEE